MRTFALIAISSAVLAAGAGPSHATTCDQAVYKCKTEANRQLDAIAKCEAAGDHCKKTGGEWIGPVTGKHFQLTR